MQHGLTRETAQRRLQPAQGRARPALPGRSASKPKLVRCTRGAIFDVVVDLRTDSATWGRWIGVELSADNPMSTVPEGCAHGYQTLADDTEMYYLTRPLRSERGDWRSV